MSNMSTRKKRSYRSESRRKQAELTKRRILAAAKKLFARYGIDKVTIDKLAAEADVSSPTIFALFQSKRGLLRALIDEKLFGKRYEALVQRAISSHPVERLRMAACIARSVYDTEKSEMRLIRGASAFSPELRKLERELELRRFERQEMTVRILAKEKALAQGLRIKQAREILWALTSRDIYRMLVMERGWSPEVYEKWLAQILVQILTKGDMRAHSK
jgi:AcrR family transcriptional regulator